MTDRDRLVELLIYSPSLDTLENDFEGAADYLIANGVIVPPCKVGDYVLWDCGLKGSKLQLKQVIGFYYKPTNLGLRFILEDCEPIINHSGIVSILTKEEAEEKLKELEDDA